MTAAQKKLANASKQAKRVEKTYKLSDDRSGESFLLKVGRDKNLLVFDEKLETNRAIRHCPNERSIFLEEQSEHALVTPIIFEFGLLEVPATEVHTQNFMDTHPDNTANGGIWFSVIDEEAEASYEVDREDLIHDIKQVVRLKEKEEDGIYHLEMVAAVLVGSAESASKMTKNELKRTIYNAIDEDPNYFLNEAGEVSIFDDEELIRKHLTLRSISGGILKRSPNNRSILWSNSGKVITTAPSGIDIIDHFSNFLSTDEGLLVVEELNKRV